MATMSRYSKQDCVQAVQATAFELMLVHEQNIKLSRANRILRQQNNQLLSALERLDLPYIKPVFACEDLFADALAAEGNPLPEATFDNGEPVLGIDWDDDEPDGLDGDLLDYINGTVEPDKVQLLAFAPVQAVDVDTLPKLTQLAELHLSEMQHPMIEEGALVKLNQKFLLADLITPTLKEKANRRPTPWFSLVMTWIILAVIVITLALLSYALLSCNGQPLALWHGLVKGMQTASMFVSSIAH